MIRDAKNMQKIAVVQWIREVCYNDFIVTLIVMKSVTMKSLYSLFVMKNVTMSKNYIHCNILAYEVLGRSRV